MKWLPPSEVRIIIEIDNRLFQSVTNIEGPNKTNLSPQQKKEALHFAKKVLFTWYAWKVPLEWDAISLPNASDEHAAWTNKIPDADKNNHCEFPYLEFFNLIIANKQRS
jgi:hypothetical protein